MSIVSAYTELPPGHEPPGGEGVLEQEITFLGKTPEGLSVDIPFPEPPKDAQYYLYWEPYVRVVWTEESEEIENDEESNGTEVGSTGDASDEEPDEGA